MSYTRRQKRLNNYYFACKCDACFADVRKGTNLRCPTCGGPVPFDSGLNTEPLLSGKCLLCYQSHDKFEEDIAELKQTCDSIRELTSLAAIVPNKERLARQAIEQVHRVVELSLASSVTTKKRVVACSKVLETLGGELFDSSFGLEDKVQVTLFMRRHLIDDLVVDLEHKNSVAQR